MTNVMGLCSSKSIDGKRPVPRADGLRSRGRPRRRPGRQPRASPTT
jgi:hypothetical protein